MKYLVVGLGNIGAEYENTRHNIGFKILDAVATASNSFFKQDRLGDVTSITIKGRNIILLKPSTYMNLSGKSVNYWLQKEKVPLENLLIITDDLALPYGTIRLKAQGNDGGHNGLKSITETLGTVSFSRLRIGIGSDFPKGRQVDYVLGDWTENEQEKLPKLYELIQDLVSSYALIGIDKTMSQFNNKVF